VRNGAINNSPERVKYIVSPPAPIVNTERETDMEAAYYIAIEEDRAASVGGHYGVSVHFDNETEDVIAAKVIETVRALRARLEATKRGEY